MTTVGFGPVRQLRARPDPGWISAAAQEEQDRRDDEDDDENCSNDADAKCCEHDRASLFKSAQTRTIRDALIMILPSACGVLLPRS